MDMCSFLLFGNVCHSCIDVTWVTISFGQHVWHKGWGPNMFVWKGEKD